jgi:hypothetical protein
MKYGSNKPFLSHILSKNELELERGLNQTIGLESFIAAVRNLGFTFFIR